jgi:hypothetical protein
MLKKIEKLLDQFLKNGFLSLSDANAAAMNKVISAYLPHHVEICQMELTAGSDFDWIKFTMKYINILFNFKMICK